MDLMAIKRKGKTVPCEGKKNKIINQIIDINKFERLPRKKEKMFCRSAL